MLIQTLCLAALSANPLSPTAADPEASYRAALLADADLREDLTLASQDGRFTLKPGLFGQMRYTSTFRRDPPDGEESTAIGGAIRRIKISLAGKAGHEDLDYKYVFSVEGGGARIAMEDAWLRAKFDGGLSLRVGQGKLPYWVERNVSSSKQLAADRSRVARVFDQGYSQLIEAGITRDRWRAFSAISDGLRSQNTELITAERADYGLTARAEVRLGEAPWKAFGDFISFPGAETGLMLGAAAHYESGGDTLGSIDGDQLGLIADVTAKGDGWNAHAAAIWRATELADGTDFEDWGALAQGGLFVSARNELFARWDTVFPDPDRSGADDPFSTITGGLNHYLFEASHAATITADVQYLLDPVEGGLIGATTSLGQLADADSGQIAIRLQLEFKF